MLIDFFDLIHYLIGLLIVAFSIWALIQVHNYFSKNNIKIVERNDLVKIFEEEDSLDSEIQQSIDSYKINLETYYYKSNKCEKAIMELKSDISVPVWLMNKKILFDEVTIKPEVLPAIADANFNGTTFESITKFVKYYNLLHNL